MTDERITEQPQATSPGEAIGPEPRRALAALARTLAAHDMHTTFVRDALLLVRNPVVSGGQIPNTVGTPAL